MKASLKRIEATLRALDNRHTTELGDTAKRPLSFRIGVGTAQQPAKENPPHHQLQQQSSQENSQSCQTPVQTFSVAENGGQMPILPKFKTPSFSNHRHAANPALAVNLLQEIQEIVARWQAELQTIVRQIQDVYLEGPIINGWLESRTGEGKKAQTATLRHAEVDRLMDYVEEICAQQKKVSSQSPRTSYHLCGLDASGTLWSCPCPPEQVASVSMAIARYHKLRQLLGRKQDIEARLTKLAESLVVVRSSIPDR